MAPHGNARRLFWAAGAVGVALRLRQYFGGASMWIDELAISLNVARRPLGVLLTAPLAYHQVAPKGFLLAEKAAWSLCAGDLSLRLFPQLCALAGLALFYRLSRRFLDDAAPTAFALFALSPALIQFGALAKQYSSDVLVAMLLTSLGLGLVESQAGAKRWTFAATAGIVLAWFSFPSALVEAGVAAAVLAVAWSRRRRESPRPAALLAAVWGANALAVFWLGAFSLSLDDRLAQKFYWRNAFLPLNLSAGRWVLSRFSSPWDYVGLGDYWGWGAGALALAGFVALLRRDRAKGLVLALPFGVTFAASAARLHPYGERATLFLLPSLIIAGAEGLGLAARRLSGRWKPLRILILALPLAPALQRWAREPSIYRIEESKPVLRRFRERRRPGDALYAYYGAAQALVYYGPEFGVARDDYAQGDCHRNDDRAYLRELDAFRGRSRVWVLFTHANGVPRTRPEMLGYLDAIGARVEEFTTLPSADRASLYLYDLSDRARLAATDAAHWPLPPPPGEDSPLRCFGPQAPGPPP